MFFGNLKKNIKYVFSNTALEEGRQASHQPSDASTPNGPIVETFASPWWLIVSAKFTTIVRQMIWACCVGYRSFPSGIPHLMGYRVLREHLARTAEHN